MNLRIYWTIIYKIILILIKGNTLKKLLLFFFLIPFSIFAMDTSSQTSLTMDQSSQLSQLRRRKKDPSNKEMPIKALSRKRTESKSCCDSLSSKCTSCCSAIDNCVYNNPLTCCLLGTGLVAGFVITLATIPTTEFLEGVHYASTCHPRHN